MMGRACLVSLRRHEADALRRAAEARREGFTALGRAERMAPGPERQAAVEAATQRLGAAAMIAFAAGRL